MRGATFRGQKFELGYFISIHAPHARSDERWRRFCTIARRKFQSTLLMRGATTDLRDNRATFLYFNPRSSCEERHAQRVVRGRAGTSFQSTLLMRGATRCKYNDAQTCTQFQSTLLMRGATRRTQRTRRRVIDFNPRSSCEERQLVLRITPTLYDFNPRSSCEERRQRRK